MYRIGVDVGGTNTDAVLLCNLEIVDTIKTTTTPDVTSGVITAVGRLLSSSPKAKISQITVGTTHFINAVLQRRRLCRVSVIRLGGPCAKPLPPFCQFPKALSNAIMGPSLAAHGGNNFDGKPITDLDEDEIKSFVRQCNKDGISHFVVSGCFSPVLDDQEKRVGAWILEVCPNAGITLSHKIGQLGMLARENASILNEALKPLCHSTLRSLISSLDALGLSGIPLYLTQNDGTLLNPKACLERPILTFNSGATNSMRGAAFLCGDQARDWPQAVVIDIGGTSTDAGLLINGFPKPAAARVHVAGVPTNFNVPELVSVALGGGSLIQYTSPTDLVKIGPLSVGNRLETDALVFGGNTLTLTDVAIANDPSLQGIGDRTLVENLHQQEIRASMEMARNILESVVDNVRVTADSIPVILVGGGAALFRQEKDLCGLEVYQPQHAGLANAVGAALAQMSASCDQVIDLGGQRDEMIEAVIARLTNELKDAGSDPNTIRLVEKDEIGIPYIPGQIVRLKVKLVGDRDLSLAESPALVFGEKMDDVDELLTTTEDLPSSSDDETKNLEIMKETSLVVRDGEWIISEYDAHCIALGTIFLGCGGGGDPEQSLLDLLCLLREGRVVKVVSVDSLHDGVIGNGAMMGSPTILTEKFMTNEQMEAVILAHSVMHCIGEKFQTSVSGVYKINLTELKALAKEDSCNAQTCAGVLPWEIGGMNGMVALINAAVSGIPAVDADCMGRAFPELQMVTPAFSGMSLCPAVIADEFGNCMISLVHHASKQLEDFFRQECALMGCSSALALTSLSPQQVRDFCIPRSISRARHVGHEILRSRKEKLDVCERLGTFLNGKLLIDGKIIDVERSVGGGFARGRLIIRSSGSSSNNDKDYISIHLQNEYLLATEGRGGTGQTMATVPDLIVILEKSSGQPLQTSEVRFGLSVCVYVFPAPPELTTETALKFVGPQAFGELDRKYLPIGNFIDLPPIL